MTIGISRRRVTAALALTALPWAAVPWARANAAADAPDSAWRTAGDLVEALASRRVSSRELLDSLIARIESRDAKINAVVVRDFERARAAADLADAALGRDERRPLLGLPVTVKEQFNVAGLPTTWGLTKFRDWKPEADALAVQRLKAAGAIVIGKTNVPASLSDWQSFNAIYGTTNNPWDLKRTPGGSSGGAAAALAAGFVPLELGSDIGGSLRAPAHFCGVFSHKPSLDLVPQRGAGFPGTRPNTGRGNMSVAGPMARSAADLALALGVLAGPDEWLEGIGYKLSLPAPRHDRLADFRVLVLDKHPLYPTAASVSGALDGLADRLAKAGCTVSRASPALPDLALTTRNYVALLSAVFAADLSASDSSQVQAAAAALSPEDQSLNAARLRGLTMTHASWIKSSRLRGDLFARWQALFREVDVVLCPPMPTVAFPHNHSSPSWERVLDVDGVKAAYDNQVAWSGIATLNGLPATVAPIGRDGSGLPIGVQIIGGYLEDYTTIAFAGLIEREFGGFVPPPEL